MPLLSTLGNASKRGFGRALYMVSKYFSTAVYTAESIPPSSTYISQEGYSGYIPLTSYADTNGSNVNSTVYQTFDRIWDNTITSTYLTNPWEFVSETSNPAPSSYPINENGYVGSIPRTSDTVLIPQTTTTYASPYTGRDYVQYQTTYRAYYSGTLTKTVTTYVPRYTGYYGGTLSKFE